MPELPEVRAHAERMTTALSGQELTRIDLISFSTLKTFDPPVDGAVGTTLSQVRTRGKLMLLDFGEQVHVVHLMQGGRLKPDAKIAKKPRGGMLRWHFADAGAWLLTEAGTERKAGVWAVRGTPEEQEPLDHLGPEADSLDASAMLELLDSKSARLHTFLRDQRMLAGLGRMLANEICHRAKLSPFAQTSALGMEEAEIIVTATQEAIADALEAERAREDMSSSKDRPSRVHNRTGEPCPACGDEVRSVEYRAYTVSYCAACQTGGKVLADNTTSKFLK